MCVIYDGLGPSSDRKRGLVERVREVLGPLGDIGERIQVWEYPERQCALYDSLNSEAAPHMVPLVAVMSGPTSFEETSDPQTGKISVVLQRSKLSLQQARVQHLLGHQIQAVAGYLPRVVPKYGPQVFMCGVNPGINNSNHHLLTLFSF